MSISEVHYLIINKNIQMHITVTLSEPVFNKCSNAYYHYIE